MWSPDQGRSENTAWVKGVNRGLCNSLYWWSNRMCPTISKKLSIFSKFNLNQISNLPTHQTIIIQLFKSLWDLSMVTLGSLGYSVIFPYFHFFLYFFLDKSLITLHDLEWPACRRVYSISMSNLWENIPFGKFYYFHGNCMESQWMLELH